MSQINPDAPAPEGPGSRPVEFASPTTASPAISRAVDPSVPRHRASEDFGPSIRLGIILLGFLLGGSRLVAGLSHESTTMASTIRPFLDAAAIALAGWVVARALDQCGRTITAAVEARRNRDARLDAARLERTDRVIAAIERLATVFESRGVPGPAAPIENRPDRTRLIFELGQALRATRLDEAGTLLDRLDAEFPDEPARQDLRDQLETARRQQSEERLAQIDAARRVNDADRVLELYAATGPSLEFDRRGELERDLARWFLDLIHRRLRVGRIQPEVVGLAARAAEVFGATVEGASLRASLPVLRRSVGLCPRCARPYVGTEAACPQCLAGVPPDAILPAAPPPETIADVARPDVEADAAGPNE